MKSLSNPFPTESAPTLMAKPASTTFESILDTPADEVERPQPMPAGTYEGIVKGMYEEGVSSQKKTPFVRFTYAITAAGEDVDEEELKAILTDKDGNLQPIGTKVMKDTYYITGESLFRLTDALECMGIDLTEKSVRAALSETPNASVRFTVEHEATQDGKGVFARVKGLLRPE